MLVAASAAPQNFVGAQYDAESDELVVEIAYRGTNPHHEFSLRWEECKPLSRSGGAHQAAALLVDDQWDDKARQEFRKTVRFSLEALPCRPAKVTLHSAPGFTWTVHVPSRPD